MPHDGTPHGQERAATAPLEQAGSLGVSFPSTPVRLAASSKEDDFFADPDPARAGEPEEDEIENANDEEEK